MIEAIMDISAGAFEELKARFESVGAKSVVQEFEGRPVLAFGTLALRRENDDNVRAYLVYDGKILNKQGEQNGRTKSGPEPEHSGARFDVGTVDPESPKGPAVV